MLLCPPKFSNSKQQILLWAFLSHLVKHSIPPILLPCLMALHWVETVADSNTRSQVLSDNLQDAGLAHFLGARDLVDAILGEEIAKSHPLSLAPKKSSWDVPAWESSD
jgi:hypothetical protein